MRVQGVNYRNTFLSVALDATAQRGETPPLRGGRATVARLRFDMPHPQPYRYTSEDVVFATSAEGRGLEDTSDVRERSRLQTAYFERSRACLRASPLPKQSGWGLHFDDQGCIAVHAIESEECRNLRAEPALQQLAAMRSSRRRRFNEAAKRPDGGARSAESPRAGRRTRSGRRRPVSNPFARRRGSLER